MKLIEGMVEKPYHLNLDWLRARGATAVPVESAFHFDQLDASRLAAALHASGYGECLAVATEELAAMPACYRVETTEEGLLDFSRECGHFNYVLVTEDRAVAVLCTSEDYFVVSGPEHFVAAAVGGGVDEARRHFLDFASDEAWPSELREALLSVHRRYAEFGGQ